jgi:hypothetical protein
VEAPAPPVVASKGTARPGAASGMEGFNNPAAWRNENGVFRHRGEALLLYGLPGSGTFVFNIHLIRVGGLFSRSKAGWVVDYTDAKNYSLVEFDDESISFKDIVNGKSTERAKPRHGVTSKEKVWTIQVEVLGDRVAHSIRRNGEWAALHTWTQSGRDFSDGRFGFRVQGDNEIGLSEFRFAPR